MGFLSASAFFIGGGSPGGGCGVRPTDEPSASAATSTGSDIAKWDVQRFAFPGEALWHFEAFRRK